MEIGLGLPVSDPVRLLEWARLAEEHQFATVALLDRLAYDNPEPLTALAVLAGATSRIRLQTEVLLGPLRSTALLAKQVATLDRMSEGRFVLGIGIGGREDDHAAAGVPIAERGRLLDTQLTDLRTIWRGEPYRAALAGQPRHLPEPNDAAAGGPGRNAQSSDVVGEEPHRGGRPGDESAGDSAPVARLGDVVGGDSALVARLGGVVGGDSAPVARLGDVVGGDSSRNAQPGGVVGESHRGGRPGDDERGSVGRGGRDDEQRGSWAGGSGAWIGPRTVKAGGPPILIGGFAPAALRRVARFADGFICAAPLDWAGGLVRTVEEQWAEAGRDGRPRLVCQINVAVGDAEMIARGRQAVADYYAFTGRPGWGAPLTDPVRIAETVAVYREFGADELVMYCYGDDPRQIEILADIVR
ncbi:LLM class flavin-dependent oxidoreductase [Actinoplanes oblitus]|uniref:LLM class flavin-dependent oxidoreductase n=1 Tax=Actinoplanes oblitus TaxID=3040509 RepID=A0ABY8WIE7_9ACTN|nr:LLM class flavin-dependent oxidoreductase [Actinoplanes oblitus]WIM97448.1 LLM class flavin-dependent oxidoreductase [Actinoplanes oblitus]